MAIVLNVFVGIKLLEDLERYRSRWAKINSVSSMPLERKTIMLRNCPKAEGVTDAPKPKSACIAMHRTGLRNANYFSDTSLHRNRRSVGKKIDGKIHSKVR